MASLRTDQDAFSVSFVSDMGYLHSETFVLLVTE